VEDLLELTQRRADFCKNLRLIAQGMLEFADYASKTVTPGRWQLAEFAGVHPMSVPRYLRFLQSGGLVGMVALGRSAELCPVSSEEYTRYPRAGATRHGDRSVYVLCEPLTAEALEEYAEEELERMENKCTINTFLTRFKAAVDISATPLPQQAKVLNPRSIREWATPTLKSHFQAAAEYVAKRDAARTDLSWPGDATTSAQNEATTRHNELQAARKVQWLVPSLSDCRSTTVASVLRPYFRAGWTANDVKHAMDHKPDGSLWPHDGFRGMSQPLIGVKVRLKPWRGLYSRSQRVVRSSEEARERALAVSAARAVPPTATTTGTSIERGVAMLRAALRLPKAV
jgi:hypothetical protein